MYCREHVLVAAVWLYSQQRTYAADIDSDRHKASLLRMSTSFAAINTHKYQSSSRFNIRCRLTSRARATIETCGQRNVSDADAGLYGRRRQLDLPRTV